MNSTPTGLWLPREWITFYLNRHEVFRIKTPKEHRRPLHVLLNLALVPAGRSIVRLTVIHVCRLCSRLQMIGNKLQKRARS